MAGEFRYTDVGTELTKPEWEGLESHIADGQTTGDILYFDGTYWKRLAVGSDGQFLYVNVNVPAYKTLAESDVANLVTDLAAKEASANKGAVSGYCGLDASQLVALTNIPTPLTGKDTDTLDTYHASSFVLASAFIVKALAADQSNSTTTLTKVTGLDQTVGVGTWKFQYLICHQAAAITTGIKFSVNHSGTVTLFVAHKSIVESTTAASTGAQSGAANSVTLMSGGSARAISTTVPLGTTISVDVINANTLTIIDGLMVVTVSGNLQLYHGSEVAAATTVKANSVLILTKVA